MFTIRRTTQRDAPKLPEIERSAGRAFLAVDALAWIAADDVQSEERHRALIAVGAAWVAVDDRDDPIGFLSAERLGGSLHVWELAVRHDLQGRGLGHALIGEAIRWAASRDLPALTLTTFRDVAWNEPFYRRLGFQTLDAGELTADLRAILDEEKRNGLPPERRCAMRYLLR